MSEIVASPRDYEELVSALEGQIAKIGLGINQLDEICGLGDRYAAKVFGPSRTKRLGNTLLWVLLPELGLRLQLVEDEELLSKRRIPGQKYAKNHARMGNYASPVSKRILSRANRYFSKLGNLARWRDTTAKQRQDHARMMARARWVKRRAKRKDRLVSRSGGTSPAAVPPSR